MNRPLVISKCQSTCQTIIPGYLITDTNTIGAEAGPTGSRADVKTLAHWENGTWSLEIVRDLDTGHKDDVIFREGESKAFGISTFNNNTNYNHAISNVLFLDMQSAKKQDIGKVTAWFLNLRSGPGMKHKIIGVLKKDEMVNILGRSGNWLLVKTEKGKTGYVYTRWINY